MALITKFMRCSPTNLISSIWVALILSGLATAVADFDGLGVCLGTSGSDIPDPKTTVQLLHKYGFKKVRLLSSNNWMMDALINQNIAVSIGIANEELPMLADTPRNDLGSWYNPYENAGTWYNTYVRPYISKMPIEYIVIGDDAILGPYSEFLIPAMRNIMQVLRRFDQGSIKVTVAVSTSVLGKTFPPSQGIFKAGTRRIMVEVLQAIAGYKFSPVLMVNVYPYRYHAAGLIRQDFATFSAHKAVIHDDNNDYWNMLDALLDAFFSALRRENLTGIHLVVGASGWPSAGNGRFTTPALAATYNQNFMRRIVRRQGTPAQPTKPIDGFVYALFNENKKPGGPDQHFGLLKTDKTPAYSFLVPTN
ncbi:probable glucan endo-1,3-beta-glucosidase BG4 [Carya illinoinensis]|uniref:glucan endo-1,3-beta-D-glucosidase n=2 Tax=Carya illinoinensis TaxID=32201 RepID=A0A8T1P8I7_CARIL|nr:probable glucan endo-1,3-beta-glucosidase BG4 [Carya illinoinensis]KAG6638071.1 hypothetical protein CIPAW_10G009700 [Carya illinoinensis]